MRIINLFKEELNDLDKKMLAKGKYFKIILPSGMGEPLYTDSFNAAKEIAKEYGSEVTLKFIESSKTPIFDILHDWVKMRRDYRKGVN